MTRPHIAVGIFGAPQGVRGDVRLKSYTADPLAIARYTGLTDAAGTRDFRIVAARVQAKDILVVRLAGIADRDSAAALTHVELFVPRASLAAPEPDEFYHADLVGLRALDTAGAQLGIVAAVSNFGAGDILEIAPVAGGETLVVSFTKSAVPVIDIAGGYLTIDPPPDAGDEREPA